MLVVTSPSTSPSVQVTIFPLLVSRWPSPAVVSLNVPLDVNLINGSSAKAEVAERAHSANTAPHARPASLILRIMMRLQSIVDNDISARSGRQTKHLGSAASPTRNATNANAAFDPARSGRDKAQRP